MVLKYKVMIVDDFHADLEELNFLCSSIEDLHIVALCSNGAEALEQISSCTPDIIVSDIDMPVMNGFELARNIKCNYPGIKIIFCSFHNEFEYARNALYLDGYGYVLKPVQPQELKQCIKDVMEEIQSESVMIKSYADLKELMEKNKPLIVENFINELIYGINKDASDIWEKIRYFGLELIEGIFCLALIEIDDYTKITTNLPIERKQILNNRLFLKLKKIYSDFCKHIILTRLDDSHFAVLYSFSKDIPKKNVIDMISTNCLYISSEYKKTDLGLSFAISDCCTEITDICNLYEQCRYAVRYKYTFGKGKAIFFNDIPYAFKRPDIDINKTQKDIRFLLNSGARDEIRYYINQLFDGINMDTDPQYCQDLCFQIVICIQTVLHEHKDSFQQIFGDEKLIWHKLLDFETIVDVRNWLIDIVLVIKKFFDAKTIQKNDVVAKDIKKYIENNFSRALNIEMIAQNFFYNPDYINYIFKESTGESIYDFLCSFKIEKAKELLSNTSMKLYEIADYLGFSHSAYFGSFFKKHTGLTPKEFRGSAND